jgi:hypothetical protein
MQQPDCTTLHVERITTSRKETTDSESFMVEQIIVTPDNLEQVLEDIEAGCIIVRSFAGETRLKPVARGTRNGHHSRLSPDARSPAGA